MRLLSSRGFKEILLNSVDLKKGKKEGGGTWENGEMDDVDYICFLEGKKGN